MLGGGILSSSSISSRRSFLAHSLSLLGSLSRTTWGFRSGLRKSIFLFHAAVTRVAPSRVSNIARSPLAYVAELGSGSVVPAGFHARLAGREPGSIGLEIFGLLEASP